MKKNLAFVVGVTPNIAFAAGAMLLGLTRHMAGRDYDLLIIQENLTGPDAEILKALPGCRFIDYRPALPKGACLPPDYPLCYYYRFEMFRLLEEYRTLIWLDCDLAVQGDLSPLAGYGPLAMARHDESCLADGVKYTLQRNFREPVPGFDMDAPFYNSGVLVLRDDLPRPQKFYDWCMDKLLDLHPILHHMDQGIFNLLVLQFPEFFQPFPTDVYNCYPLNPGSTTARIVHCFGARKFWNNALLALCFPEWLRDYRRWLDLGGSPYAGPVEDEAFLGRGSYALSVAMVDRLNTLLEGGKP